MSKKSKIVEAVWLATSAIALLTGIHKTYNQGFAKSYPFFIITGVALLMFTFRRYLRIYGKKAGTDNPDNNRESEK
ncbi:MAG: hypothetical protein KJ607_04800 [Bacteroidetes bacterium]|nr:hypothetical protein [Bacteroidota bacterium]